MLLTVAFIVIVAMTLWTVALFVARAARAAPARPTAPPGAADALHVGLPGAGAERGRSRSRDSVDAAARRAAGAAARSIVIDDGSDDATPEILARFDHPDLHVLRRDKPDARAGQGRGAQRRLSLLGDAAPRRRSRARDRRASSTPTGASPRRRRGYAAAHFADPQRRRRAGARAHLQPRGAADAHAGHRVLASTAHVYQAGRNGWGTAGMGGNGQFNRLSALDAIATRRARGATG